MKKFIISLICLACVFIVNAQNSTTYDVHLGYGDTYSKYSNSSSNAWATGDSTWTFTIWKDAMRPLKYDLYLDLDSVSGKANKETVYFQGKKWLDQSTWTNLRIKRWTLGSDTVITLSDSIARYYQYFRTYIRGDSSSFKIRVSKHNLKVYEP